MAEAPKTPQAQANTVRPMTPEEIRQAEAAEQARIVAEVEERNATTTVDGGRYMLNDVLVDADGKPISDKKD
jgi:hypothetical protein